MEIIKRLSEFDTSAIAIAFMLKNWVVLSALILVVLVMSYVAWTKSTEDDRFLGIVIDQFKKIFNFIRLKGFWK